MDIFQVLIIIHSVKLNMMSQIQQAKQFKMTTESPKWLQESLKLRKITNMQPDTQKRVYCFQELHTSLPVFSTRVIRIWHYNIYLARRDFKKGGQNKKQPLHYWGFILTRCFNLISLLPPLKQKISKMVAKNPKGLFTVDLFSNWDSRLLFLLMAYCVWGL